MRIPLTPVAVALALLLWASVAGAQTAQVRQVGTGATRVVAEVGDTLSLEVAADLGDLRVSGVSLYLSLPAQGLSPIAASPTGPFRPGLFAGGVEFANERVPADETWGVPAGAVLLTYAVVLGPGAPRFRTGAGAVATLDLVCTGPVDGEIRLFGSPAHASNVVLDDGRSELDLLGSGGVRISVEAVAARRTQGSWATLKAHHLP